MILFLSANMKKMEVALLSMIKSLSTKINISISNGASDLKDLQLPPLKISHRFQLSELSFSRKKDFQHEATCLHVLQVFSEKENNGITLK